MQFTNPEIIKYAQSKAQQLRDLGQIDTQTAQDIVQNYNNSLQAFYRNPTYEAASKVSIDAGVVNNLRKALDDSIEKATGEEYQVLKNQYAALKDADALLILTEWSVFRTPDFDQLESLLKAKVIFDGRNLYDIQKMIDCGYYYNSIGRKVVS